jgi:plasmid stability protein
MRRTWEDVGDPTRGGIIPPTMSERTSLRGRDLRETVAPYASRGSSTSHTKLSISLPSDLVEVVRVAAAESGLTVSATIAAALRRTIEDAEQARLDTALAADREDNLALARAYVPIAADLMATEEW